MCIIDNAKLTRRSVPRRTGRTFLVTAATLALAAGALSTAPGFRGWWAPAPASAAVTVNPVAPALGFNAISEGDTYLAGTESEGPIAVGGDLSFGRDYRVRIHNDGTFTDTGESNPVALLVQGEVDFEDSDPQGVLSIPTGAYVKIGDLDDADVYTTDLNNASANTRIVPQGAGYEGYPRVQLSTMQPADSVGPAPDLIDFEEAFSAFRS
ncbi:hypothetical protein A9R04_06045 [Nocardiopsis dassonvillei]|nr:hypothetical protein A9R04_06045 [Nocardiopsis dassonvillei]